MTVIYGLPKLRQDFYSWNQDVNEKIAGYFLDTPQNNQKIEKQTKIPKHKSAYLS